jgi:hypothetical protein
MSKTDAAILYVIEMSRVCLYLHPAAQANLQFRRLSENNSRINCNLESQTPNAKLVFPARFKSEVRLGVQGNLETAVEFLSRPRRWELSLVAPWFRPNPAKIPQFFAGKGIGFGRQPSFALT